MDTAMRDLEQIQERDDDLESRRMVAWGLAILTTLAVVLSVAMALGDATPGVDDGAAASKGPGPDAVLAALGAAETEDDVPGVPGGLDRAPLVDPANLRFPEALADIETVDERPEVVAALAAAEAELASPDPTGAAGGSAETPAPAPVVPVAPPRPETGSVAPPAIARQLPAATAAEDPEPGIARVVHADPLLRQVEADAEEVAPREKAQPGHDGDYTLQVVSYDTRERAETFAEELRARGHRAFVQSADVPGRGRFHRVRVGPFDAVGDAERYRRQFEADEQIATFVVRRRD